MAKNSICDGGEYKAELPFITDVSEHKSQRIKESGYTWQKPERKSQLEVIHLKIASIHD
jgi:hypothetical protein